MVGTEAEDVYLTNLPSGFRTTFKEGERLRRLLNYGSTDIQNDLQGVVEDYNGNQLTEQQLIRSIADQINTSFLLPERTIELPGLQLALDPDLFGPGWGRHGNQHHRQRPHAGRRRDAVLHGRLYRRERRQVRRHGHVDPRSRL